MNICTGHFTLSQEFLRFLAIDHRNLCCTWILPLYIMDILHTLYLCRQTNAVEHEIRRSAAGKWLQSLLNAPICHIGYDSSPNHGLLTVKLWVLGTIANLKHLQTRYPLSGISIRFRNIPLAKTRYWVLK